jgi:ABC-type Na+ efflux pump permease subunit
MPIAKSTLAVIARLTKTKVEDLESAEKAETEVEITIDEKLNVFSEDEVTVLKNNEYKNGKDKGVEMAVKDAKERMGLDFTGKTIDGLLSAAQKKALEDAKIEPAKQVQELQEKLKTVQVTASELQAKLTEKETEIPTLIAGRIPLKNKLDCRKI